MYAKRASAGNSKRQQRCGLLVFSEFMPFV
jgi:hypothetical protein